MARIVVSVAAVLLLILEFGFTKLDHENRQTEMQQVIIPLQTLIPLTGDCLSSASVIDFAYSRESQGSTAYYAFDEDTKTVLYFDNHEPYAEKGTFTGSPGNGIEMLFTVPGEEWTETLTLISPCKACIDMGNGYRFDYYMCSSSEAESVLIHLGLDIGSLINR